MAEKQSQKVTELRKIPIKRLFFVMKHIAEENRWTEYAQALAKVGHTAFVMDLETVEAVKQAIRKRVPVKGIKGKKRGRRIEKSASCGSGWGGHPTPPPSPPPPPPPPDGGVRGGGPPKKKKPKARPKRNPPRDIRKKTGRKAPVK